MDNCPLDNRPLDNCRNTPPLPPGEEHAFPEDIHEERMPAAIDCTLCTAEIDAIDPGDRAGHGCTHHQVVQGPGDGERSVHGAEVV